MKSRCLCILLALALLIPIGASARVHEYVEMLGGPDEPNRFLARQHLRRHDPERVVPHILPLLEHDDQHVWRAAFQTLSDIANAVTVAGREEEQAFVTAQLMTLLAPDRSDHAKEQGLRLVPFVAPDQFDLGPIARLLDNPDMREKARAALEEMKTPSAAAVLADALGRYDANFTRACLLALARVQDEHTLPAVKAMTDHGDPAVRSAAARALAWTGDVLLIRRLEGVANRADAETAWEAYDGLLRLADAIAERGGNWQHAIGVYRHVLAEAEDPITLGGALNGLGRFGDETVVPDILAALDEHGVEAIGQPAVVAMDRLKGMNTHRALLEAYPDMPEELHPPMIQSFGHKQESLFMPVIEEAAASEDPAMRWAALHALLAAELPESVDSLTALAEDEDDEIAEAALEGLADMASRFRQMGARDEASMAYLAVHGLTDDDELRRVAVERLTEHPVPGAFEVIMEAFDDDDMEDLSPALLAGVARELINADRHEEAQDAIDRVLDRADSTPVVEAILQHLGDVELDFDLSDRLGFVRSWKIVGPFPWDEDDGFTVTHVDQPDVDLDATYTVDDEELRWERVRTEDVAGHINLMGVVGPHTHCAAYAWTTVHVEEEIDVILQIGSDDGVKAWVNGEAVHEHNIDRGVSLDADQAPATFQEGENEILMQITQNLGGWGFCLRLTDADGMPLEFEVVE